MSIVCERSGCACERGNQDVCLTPEQLAGSIGLSVDAVRRWTRYFGTEEPCGNIRVFRGKVRDAGLIREFPTPDTPEPGVLEVRVALEAGVIG